MSNENPYAVPRAELKDIDVPKLDFSERNHATVSLTATELQSAEAVVAARLDRLTPGITISQYGGVLAGALVVFPLFTLWSAEFPAGHMPNLSVQSMIGILALGGIISVALSSFSSWRLARILYGQGSKLLQPYTLEITPTALLIQSTGSRAEVSWSNIEDIVETPQQTIIVLAPNHGIPVLPRCFPHDAEYKAFVLNLRSHVNRAA